MKLVTRNLETKRLILKRVSTEDYELVYEFDFTKLKNITDYVYILSKEKFNKIYK